MLRKRVSTNFLPTMKTTNGYVEQKYGQQKSKIKCAIYVAVKTINPSIVKLPRMTLSNKEAYGNR